MLTIRDIKCNLAAAVMSWSVLGFPLLAGLASALDLNSTAYSIAARSTMLMLSVAAIVLSTWRKAHMLTLYLWFWFVYLARIFYDTTYQYELLSRQPVSYWLWAVGACFLPGLAVLVATTAQSVQRGYKWMLVGGIVASGLVIAFGQSFFFSMSAKQIIDINRLSLESLNPISAGHLGATTFILGLCLMLFHERKWRTMPLALVGILLGLTLAVLSNSRGPLLAAGLVVAAFVIMQIKTARAWLAIIIIGLAVLGAATFFQDKIYGSKGVVSRLSGMTSSSDMSTAGRLMSYSGAIEQFLSSPIVGDYLEERQTLYYPHNVTLESFMATGLLGGIPFAALTFMALWQAIQLIRRNDQTSWLGFVTMQYIFAAQTSGALYLSTPMWVLMAATYQIGMSPRRIARAPRNVAPHKMSPLHATANRRFGPRHSAVSIRSHDVHRRYE